ncbi:MAG: metallophosphoesterase [Cellulosilyticaceae bacterium]
MSPSIRGKKAFALVLSVMMLSNVCMPTVFANEVNAETGKSQTTQEMTQQQTGEVPNQVTPEVAPEVVPEVVPEVKTEVTPEESVKVHQVTEEELEDGLSEEAYKEYYWSLAGEFTEEENAIMNEFYREVPDNGMQRCIYIDKGKLKLKGDPSSETWTQGQVYNASDITKIAMQQGKDLKILLITDVQLVATPIKEKRALEMVENLVKKTQPDLVITLGDNTSGVFSHFQTRRFVKFMQELNVPWAITLGNHDSEGLGDRNWHGNQYEGATQSLFKMGPSNIHGVGNYGINVESPQGDIVYSLIMMDTNVDREEGFDHVYQDQMDWYKWMVEGVSKAQYGDYAPESGKVVPSMVFFHIPTPEFQQASDAVARGEIDPSTVFGANKETVCAPLVNNGFFDLAKQLQSTSHIFAGHDHNNSLSVNWENIRLTYVLKTGPTSYSLPEMQGGTLLTIKDGTHAVEVEHLYMK